VNVVHVTMSPGDEDPNEEYLATEQLFELDGATQVACDPSTTTGICIIAGDVIA
jgi:hypothetical protein